MIYGSVCSGIEAATIAWEPLGWKAAWYSEIEKFPSAVLKERFPETPNLGDMMKLRKRKIFNERAIQLLVGGTPCQSFSIAGLRKGLADPRGNLALGFLGLLAAKRPRWVVWENVPGVLSSLSHNAPDPCPPPPPVDMERDGQEMETQDEYGAEELHAFNSFLAGLSELGYGWAYAILDAQYFGLAQRRNRVFVVGCLGNRAAAEAVLFDRESLQGHPAPRRKTGQGITHDVAGSLTSSGRGIERTGESRGPDPVIPIIEGGSHWDGADVHPTLNQSAAASGGIGSSNQEIFSQRGAYLVGAAEPVIMAHGQGNAEVSVGSAPTLTCNHEAPILAHALRADGFDASEDGTGRGTPLVPVRIDMPQHEVIGALTDGAHNGGGLNGQDAYSGRILPVAFSCKDHGQDAIQDISPTLRAMGHNESHANSGGQIAIAIQERAVSENPDAGPDGIGVRADDCAYTLEARQTPQAVAFAQNSRDEVRMLGGDGQVAGALAAETGMKQQSYVAFAQNQAGEVREGEVFNTLNTNSSASGRNTPMITYPINTQIAMRHEALGEATGMGIGSENDPAFTLQAAHHHAVGFNHAVRRLTPRECARLQGFPDDHAKIPWKGKPAEECPDGPQYKTYGNAMAVPCMRWLGSRIQMVDDILEGKNK